MISRSENDWRVIGGVLGRIGTVRTETISRGSDGTVSTQGMTQTLRYTTLRDQYSAGDPELADTDWKDSFLEWLGASIFVLPSKTAPSSI